MAERVADAAMGWLGLGEMATGWADIVAGLSMLARHSQILGVPVLATCYAFCGYGRGVQCVIIFNENVRNCHLRRWLAPRNMKVVDPSVVV